MKLLIFLSYTWLIIMAIAILVLLGYVVSKFDLLGWVMMGIFASILITFFAVITIANQGL